MRSASSAVLVVGLFLVGQALGGFVQISVAPVTCRVAQACTCAYDAQVNRSVVVINDTWRNFGSQTPPPATTPVGTWECGGPGASPQGDIYGGNICPAPPSGTPTLGKGLYSVSGCN
jgi:hypothetical protein